MSVSFSREDAAGINVAPQTIGKKIKNEFNYNYQELDEKTLDDLTKNLGRNESSEMGHKLLKFYASLVEPAYYSGVSDNIFSNDVIFRGLPVWLYPFLNVHMEIYLANIKSSFFNQYMPPWYLEYYKEKMDVQLVNSYVVFVMDNFDEYLRNENLGVGNPNEARRDYFQKRFGWVMEEKRKTWYMIQRLRNKFADISIYGIKDQGDMLFLYFANQLLRNIMTDNTETYIPKDFKAALIFPEKVYNQYYIGLRNAKDASHNSFKYIYNTPKSVMRTVMNWFSESADISDPATNQLNFAFNEANHGNRYYSK